MQLVQTLVDKFGEEGYNPDRSNLQFIHGSDVYPITGVVDRKVVYVYDAGSQGDKISHLRPEYSTDLAISKVLIRRTVRRGRLITFVLNAPGGVA